MAFRMLAEMRVDLFRKLDELAPAYLTRRRSGDLVSMATHDVEMVEYFFAHTIAPAFVAILVPSVVLLTLVVFDWHLALALLARGGARKVLATERARRVEGPSMAYTWKSPYP